jgi:uncharacterized membrane protein YbhN (UPF0104 family)
VTGQDKDQPSSLMRWLRFALKLALSLVAIWYVTRKLDVKAIIEVMRGVHPAGFVLALLVFNVSKLISTLRLRILLEGLGHPIGWRDNVRLLYIGSFYNLFLPGSVGGDGYKVLLLQRLFGGGARPYIAAVLLDRVNGLAALGVLTCSLVWIARLDPGWPWWSYAIAAGPILCYLAYALLLRFFPSFRKGVWRTHAVSLVVQLTQVLCAWALLLALDIDHQQWNYLTLFMLTSVAAVIPFTIGGLGARELVTLAFGARLGVDPHAGVAFSLLFFCVLAISALPGLVLAFWPVRKASARA